MSYLQSLARNVASEVPRRELLKRLWFGLAIVPAASAAPCAFDLYSGVRSAPRFQQVPSPRVIDMELQMPGATGITRITVVDGWMARVGIDKIGSSHGLLPRFVPATGAIELSVFSLVGRLSAPTDIVLAARTHIQPAVQTKIDLGKSTIPISLKTRANGADPSKLNPDDEDCCVKCDFGRACGGGVCCDSRCSDCCGSCSDVGMS